MKIRKNTKLYFLQDLSFGSRQQVYSGHSGTGRNFRINMGDYGKYAMKPTTKTRCNELAKRIEKDAKGKLGKGTCVFKWNIVPMIEIDLCNFYRPEDQKEFDNLKEEQLKLK